MAESVTERPIHQPPVMHFSGVGAVALVEGGFLPQELLINPYRDDEGKLKCDGMNIPADIFTRSIQRVLKDDFIHHHEGKQEQLGDILYVELGEYEIEAGPMKNVETGLQRYQDTLQFIRNGRNVDPNDLATIRNSLQARLSILQGLDYYQHDFGTTRTLPTRVVKYIPKTEEIKKLEARLAELDAQNPYIPIDERPTQEHATVSKQASFFQPSPLNKQDRDALKATFNMLPWDE